MIHLLLVVIYLSFISLGLPDSLLGSAWPSIFPQFNVPVSFAGIISMIIAFGTIFSSLQSDRLTRRFGAGKVTAFSVLTTAVALFGFSTCSAFWMMCLWAVPYGLGAGSVDSALNNYVALHYKSRQMSWLHCMWGIGAATGPYIMGFVLANGGRWNGGYRTISYIQIILTAIILFSLPLWKKMSEKPVASVSENDALKMQKKSGNASDAHAMPADSASAGGTSEKQVSAESSSKSLSLRQIFRIPGAKEVMLCFFCYCAVEQTSGLWAASYLTVFRGIPAETAAGFAALFYIGITAGRFVNGFASIRFSDRQLIRTGAVIILAGVVILALPLSQVLSLAGFILIGLGCAPVYPCLIHSTPSNFGADKSQAVIGVQMASAYTGTLLMPPLFGIIASHNAIFLLPVYLAANLIVMFIMHEKLLIKTKK